MKRLSAIPLTLISLLFAAGCAVEDTSADGTAADREATEAPAAPAPKDKAPAKPEGPTLTSEQEQAVGTAEDYLDYTAFSKSGLINQLKSEGYSRKDAIVAVNTLTVNWNNEAAMSAKDYLDYTHFSRQGLIDQLKSEGYTEAQAEYGVSKTSLG